MAYGNLLKFSSTNTNRSPFVSLKILKEPFDDHSSCEILVRLILIQLQKSRIRRQKNIKGRNHQRKFNVITNLRAAKFQGQKILHLISGSSETKSFSFFIIII